MGLFVTAGRWRSLGLVVHAEQAVMLLLTCRSMPAKSTSRIVLREQLVVSKARDAL